MRKYPKYDPFVFASQVQQVYFTPYPSTKRDKYVWWVVYKVKVRSTIDALVDNMAFLEDMNDNPPTLSIVELKDEDTLVDYNELIEIDLKEANSEQDEYKNANDNDDYNEDQYQYYDEDEDDNEEDL